MRHRQESAKARAQFSPGRSVLIVEREAAVAREVRSSLVRLGYDVAATVASATEALAAVDAHRPDLVLMDVCLEDRDDGIAVAAAIRTRHPTPIVFLSARDDDAARMRVEEDGRPHGFVLRPYQDPELHAAVEVALERHALEREMDQQRSWLARVFGGMSDAVAAADMEGRILFVNEGGRRVFGETFIGTGSGASASPDDVYLPDCETRIPDACLPLARALAGEVVRDVELFVRARDLPDGRFYSINAEPLFDATGEACGAVATGRDVTSLRAARSRLREQVELDALTGVYNRRGFMDLARRVFENARESGRDPAVFFIDLNEMKVVNDSLGHPEGDRLLMDVARILRGCLRTSDILGRLGGDEFVVLAPDSGAYAEVLRQRLRAAVDEFNAACERPYRVSLSIGLSTCEGGHIASLDELVAQADKRMYEDKRVRRARRNHPKSGRRLVSSVRPALLPPPGPSTGGCEPFARGRAQPSPGEAAPSPRAFPHEAQGGAPGTATVHDEALRLLLVDDDPAVLRAYRAALARGGATVETASNGKEAAERVQRGPIDVIVSDLSMPEMTGIEFLEAVRAHDLDVPVILMTGEPKVESAIRAVEYGAFRYLVKPVGTQELLETATRAAKLHRLARLKREALNLAGADATRLGERAALEVRWSHGMNLLWMAFQPIVGWARRRVFGYEALLRSDEPLMRNPTDFLDAAERLGRLHELGRAVRAAVAKAAPKASKRAKLFVNLHAADLNDDELYSPDAPLSKIASRVVLEVTERASLYGVKNISACVARLKKLGFDIAIDDLGAGYAGLASFTQLEPEVAKLDMSLVRGIDMDSRRHRIVRAMKSLCDDLGILVVAEGVETVGERNTLTELGCDLLQGYLFATPAAGFEAARL
ncbi:MAG: EAL domain-containing protein [Polyangiaceae bacterium]